MSIDEGYILSNKYRRTIFEELASGEKSIYRIAKKNRIIQKVAQRIIDGFVDEGIVEKQGNTYGFTKEGEKLVEIIGK
jgi:predicted transcriptional regulator